MRAVAELARYGVGGRNLRVFRTSADREAALLQQILAPALRSRNPERRKEAVEALENLAAVTTHLKHLLLVRDLRRLCAWAGPRRASATSRDFPTPDRLPGHTPLLDDLARSTPTSQLAAGGRGVTASRPSRRAAASRRRRSRASWARLRPGAQAGQAAGGDRSRAEYALEYGWTRWRCTPDALARREGAAARRSLADRRTARALSGWSRAGAPRAGCRASWRAVFLGGRATALAAHDGARDAGCADDWRVSDASSACGAGARPAPAGAAAAHARRAARARARAPGTRRARRWRWRTCGCRRRGSAAAGCAAPARVVGEGGRARRPRRACCACRRQGLSRPRAAARRATRGARPTPSCCPATPPGARACCRRAPRRASPSCRSAAARASSAASSRCAARIAARRRARPRAADRLIGARRALAGRRRSSRACAAPEARARAGRARPHARPLPAVASSTRRSAAASRRARPARPRPATGASTSWSRAARCVAPAGDLDAADAPGERRGAGPARAASLGSEGDARRHHRGRRCGCARAARARATRAGCSRLRGGRRGAARARAGAARRRTSRGSPTRPRPDDARAGRGAAVAAALRGYLRRARLAAAAWRSSAGRATPAASRRRRGALAVLRAHGALPLGAAPGPRWARGALPRALPARRPARPRRDGRDARDRDDVVRPRRAATARSRDGARARHGARSSCCHVSHLYPTGASLYFTFLARAGRGRPVGAVARGQGGRDARRSSPRGGTITHHHAVGRDHAPWLGARSARSGVELLRAVKDALDPAGIMNPGKLLPLSGAAGRRARAGTVPAPRGRRRAGPRVVCRRLVSERSRRCSRPRRPGQLALGAGARRWRRPPEVAEPARLRGLREPDARSPALPSVGRQMLWLRCTNASPARLAATTCTTPTRRSRRGAVGGLRFAWPSDPSAVDVDGRSPLVVVLAASRRPSSRGR